MHFSQEDDDARTQELPPSPEDTGIPLISGDPEFNPALVSALERSLEEEVPETTIHQSKQDLIASVDQLLSDELPKHKKFLENQQQKFDRIVAKAEKHMTTLMTSGDFDVQDMISASECRDLTSTFASLQMISRYNIPDKDGQITPASQKRDVKFFNRYITHLLITRQEIEIRKIWRGLTECVLAADTQFRFAWTDPGVGSPKHPTSFLNSRLDSRILRGVQDFLLSKGFLVEEEEASVPNKDRIFLVRWDPATVSIVKKRQDDLDKFQKTK